jgi:hypothetical protein
VSDAAVTSDTVKITVRVNRPLLSLLGSRRNVCRRIDDFFLHSLET